jgi:hypothetical protein
MNPDDKALMPAQTGDQVHGGEEAVYEWDNDYNEETDNGRNG